VFTPKPVPVTVSNVPPALAPVFGDTLKNAGANVMVLIELAPAGKPDGVRILMSDDVLSFIFVILNTTDKLSTEKVVC